MLGDGRLKQKEGIARVRSPHFSPPNATFAALRQLQYANSRQTSKIIRLCIIPTIAVASFSIFLRHDFAISEH
jgi:hypothetical protein